MGERDAPWRGHAGASRAPLRALPCAKQGLNCIRNEILPTRPLEKPSAPPKFYCTAWRRAGELPPVIRLHGAAPHSPAQVGNPSARMRAVQYNYESAWGFSASGSRYGRSTVFGMWRSSVSTLFAIFIIIIQICTKTLCSTAGCYWLCGSVTPQCCAPISFLSVCVLRFACCN